MSKICVTPKSARKRILFSKTPPEECSSDSTLGHISPLSSSPDRYSSPPPSPQWLTDTPPTKLIPRYLNKIEKSNSGNREYSTPSVLRPLQLVATPRKKVIKSIEMEIIEESPLKDTTQTVLATPFKCLAAKENDEITPELRARKLVISESPDVSSVAAPIKHINKSRQVSAEPTPEAKPRLPNSDPVKLSALSASSFYSSRARAALFPDQGSNAVNTFSSALDKKRKRSKSAETFYSYRHFPVMQVKSQIKRRKLGEINVGVCHGIKKHKRRSKKLETRPYAVRPKVTPADRVISYLDKIDPSILNMINDELEMITQRPDDKPNNIQQNEETVKNVNDDKPSLTKNLTIPVERAPSPQPDPNKKFFKTKRTLKINTSATVTVDKNIK